VTAAPWLAIYLAVRHGPVRNRWWVSESALGVACFVGTVSFAAGFLGPMILAPGANQGPLLGILITGPAGFVVGLAAGIWRAARRR
jgi:hypothetical protein